MNIFQEAKTVLDKDGKVNPLGPFGKQKLTGTEVSGYFKKNTVSDKIIKKAVEVALDLSGAMDIAAKEIGKFYGNSVLKSKEVQHALRFANESFLEKNTPVITESALDDMRDIVKNKSAKKIEGQMVDMFTASAVVQIYDKISDANKAKMEKSKLSVLIKIAHKVMGLSESNYSHAEDVFDLEEALTSQEKKVIDAFYDGKDMDGKTLVSKGDKLETTGMGAQVVLKRQGSKFRIFGVIDGRRVQEVIRYIKKSYPKNTIIGEEFTEDTHPCKGLSEDDPCWKDYKQVGMKKKNGKDVPNCVPKEDVAEAVSDWTVTVKKPVNKLKKGATQKVKARSAFEAINKAVKLWGDPALKMAPMNSFSITKESVDLEEASFWGQDKMVAKSKELMGPKTHVRLTREKGGYERATVSKKDKKKIAQMKKDGYKIDPTFAKEEIEEAKKMSSDDKKKFTALYKAMDGGKEHQAIRSKIHNPIKADDAFHALVMKKVMEFNEPTNLDQLDEASITYRVRGMQKPEMDKFITTAKSMKLTLTTKKDGGNTLVTLTGTKKKLRDTDGVVRGKSSYGDPSTTDHFDESLEEAISRDKNLSKKDIDGIEGHIYKSYINKKTLSLISFDDDAIFHAKTGKTIFTSKDYIGKMTIDDLIKALEKKVK